MEILNVDLSNLTYARLQLHNIKLSEKEKKVLGHKVRHLNSLYPSCTSIIISVTRAHERVIEVELKINSGTKVIRSIHRDVKFKSAVSKAEKCISSKIYQLRARNHITTPI